MIRISKDIDVMPGLTEAEKKRAKELLWEVGAEKCVLFIESMSPDIKQSSAHALAYLKAFRPNESDAYYKEYLVRLRKLGLVLNVESLKYVTKEGQ